MEGEKEDGEGREEKKQEGRGGIKDEKTDQELIQLHVTDLI